MDIERARQLLSRLRNPWVAGVIVLFLLVYAVLVLSYLRQQAQLHSLEREQANLASIATGAATKERLARVEAELEAIQEAIPPATLKEIDVFLAMKQLASEHGLACDLPICIRLVSETRQKVGNAEYRVLSFSMTVSGRYESVWSFVQRMDRGDTPYETLVLDQTSIQVGRTGSASMVFRIYTQVAKA